MNQTNPEVSNAFGTEIMQPRTVEQMLFALPTLGLINLALSPELSIVFFDHHVKENKDTVDFHCVLGIEKYMSPVYIEVLKNSNDRPFSKTYLTYGDVFKMKCKSVDCTYVGDPSRELHKYSIHIDIPGLYEKVAEAEEENQKDLFGLGSEEVGFL